MNNRRWWIIPVIVLALLFGALVVWPAVDRELMKTPLTDGVNAIRSGDIGALRNCFTTEAVVYLGKNELPAGGFIDVIAPIVREHRDMANFRFGGYSRLRRHGKMAEADFTIVIQAKDEELLDQSVPIRQTGHVELERQGWFTWKITRIGTDERGLNRLLPAIPGM